jgi:hypothetical protein
LGPKQVRCWHVWRTGQVYVDTISVRSRAASRARCRAAQTVDPCHGRWLQAQRSFGRLPVRTAVRCRNKSRLPKAQQYAVGASMTRVRRSTVAPCRTHCAFEMQSLAQLATEARSVAKLRHLELAASEWAQLQPWLPWLGTQSCARTLYCSLRQSSSAARGAAHEASRPRLALLSDAAVPLVTLRWNGGASVSMEARARHRLMGLRHWHFTPAAQATEQQSSKVLRPPYHASGPEAMNLTLTPRRERRSAIMLV